MVMFLAALKNVPADLYEAAAIDGAKPVQQFFKITIPQITPIIFFNLINQTITALQNFTSAFVIIMVVTLLLFRSSSMWVHYADE